MNNDFKIGASIHSKTPKVGKVYFYIKDNEDNVFRVLPPLFSLADKGKYAAYYSTHKVRGTDGRQRVFRCIEEVDRKTKMIIRHCPLCDKVRELENQIKAAKDSGAADDQVRNFRIKNIMPLQAENRYWLNVVNQENVIGLLNVPSRMFNSLRVLCEEYDKKGIDLTGATGYFLNFQKLTQFKGDKNAVHKVSLYMQAETNSMSFRPVTHTLTPEFIERLKTEASDLSDLFKTISQEEIAAIASASDSERPVIVDRIFAKPESTVTSEPTLERTVVGTTAIEVSRIELNSNGVTTVGLGLNTENPAVKNNNLNVNQIKGTSELSIEKHTDFKQAGGLTDEEFLAMFLPNK